MDFWFRNYINQETSPKAIQSAAASTLTDGSFHAKNDRININPDYLRARRPQKFQLAQILAHEARHAKERSKDNDVQEANACSKQLDAIDALKHVAQQEISDQIELIFILNMLSLWEIHAQIKKQQHEENLRRKHSSIESYASSKSQEPERVAISLELDDIRVLIVSSESFMRIYNKNAFEEKKISFQKIEKPLSGVELTIKGEDFLVVSGTAFNDSTGLIEVFRFLKRSAEDGTQVITGVDPQSEVIFQMDNLWPASVTIDRRNDNIYILDLLEHRILLLKDGSLMEIANAKKFKEIKELKTLGFGKLEKFFDLPTLGGSTISYSSDSHSPLDKSFQFIDYNNDFIINDVKTFMLRELTSFKPDFHIEPFAGEDEVFIWATFNSQVKVVTETGELLGEIKKVPFELPAQIKLSRKLQEGEIIKLIDTTTGKEGRSHTVRAPKPTVVDLFPEIGQEMKFPTVAIFGKYFAPDSRVFVPGFPGDTLVVKDDLIIARIPTFRRVEEFNPVDTEIEIRSVQAGSTFVDFRYYNKSDYLRELKDLRGAMFKKRKMVMQILKSLREDPKHSSNLLYDEKIKLEYIDGE